MNPSEINASQQSAAESSNRSSARNKTLCLALGAALLPGAVFCQVTQSKPDDPGASIARIKTGSFSNTDIEIVARAGASQGVLPALEQQFAVATEIFEQGMIAKALVRLGDKNNIYWDFLFRQASLAVDSDLPDPFHDSLGNPTGTKQFSPELMAWAEAHHVDVNTAGVAWIQDLPGKVLLLGTTGDRRGIPLLRRALQSHNDLMVVFAAKGLALIQDKDSIPLISAAIQRSPRVSSLIAESLIYFDDPLAQSTVDIYMPKEKAKMERDERARGRGVFGW